MNPESTPRTTRREMACVLVLVAIFMCFTWRGLTMFFSGDDLMNMYKAWTTPARKIWKAQVLPWMPLYRPLGTAVYRVFYTIFGFHPLPLYIFSWLLLIGNVVAAWRFFRVLTPSVFVALLALSLTLVHALFEDLYLSAGTIYDRLCFLFTVLAVIVYARTRREGAGISAGRVALLCLICMTAINSKESGAAVAAILLCYECVYCLPDVWQTRRVSRWIRSIAPFYCLMGFVLAAFVFGRVRGTQDLNGNPAYQPHSGVTLWLAHVAEYLNILVYRYVHFTATNAAIALTAMLLLAAILRNRAMLFGWLYFVMAITPVALISVRQGYVLYVPELGLGLYFATLTGLAATRIFPRNPDPVPESLSLAHVAFLAVVTALTVWLHATHWPQPWRVSDSAGWRLTEKMVRDYPTLKPGAKVLFVDDYNSGNGYDSLFNLRLLYHDPQIQVARLRGPAIQQPDRSGPLQFDYVLTTALGTYVELDIRNVEESIRLNILRDLAPGRHFDTTRADSVAYVVSGLQVTGQADGWWTERSGKLKFDVYPADSVLSLQFRVPDFVAAGQAGNLSAVVNGETVGSVPLIHDGVNNAAFPVPARVIGDSGFTVLELNVDKPYIKNGQEFGVLIVQAGFDYVPGRTGQRAKRSP